MKVYYFDGRGRAEPARALLRLGGVEFEDVRFNREQWKDKYKAMSPTGQCPWIELDDGTCLAQSLAIYMQCASLAGYMPEDPLQVARTAELYLCFEDTMAAIGPTFMMQDLEEKIAARKAMLAEDGKLHKAYTVLNNLAGKVKTKFYCGDKPTMADILLYISVSASRSGMLDGISKQDVDKYEHLAALRSKVAALPLLQEMYAGVEGYEA